MILHGNQRGGARNLALHLLNTQDNEQVDVHELRGFVGDTLPEAFQEAYAISRATKCKQFLFSVSLSPPRNANVSTVAFEKAVGRVEEELKLSGQPRAIVFHEKNGRRHAHCVWSRIDGDALKAINMPFYKSKLKELSKELFLEHGWNMPKGLIDYKQRNPLNFTLEQWQQAKRFNDDPRRIKATLQECWVTSDGRKAYKAALERKGYYLARGDRRGFVAVDWRGEIYSLSRWSNVKTKELKARLGEPKELASVEETKKRIDQKFVERMNFLTNQINEKYRREMKPLEIMRRSLTEKHRQERTQLIEAQETKRIQQAKRAQARFRKGLMGWFDVVTGKRRQLQTQIEREAWAAARRDQTERDQKISTQIEFRARVQEQIDVVNRERQEHLHRFHDRSRKRLSEIVQPGLAEDITIKHPSMGRGPVI